MRDVLALLKRPLLQVAGFSLFINLLLLVPSIFMLQVFDRVLVSRSSDTLIVLVIGAAVGLAILLALDYIRARLQGVAGNVLSEALVPVVTRISLAQGALRNGAAATERLRDIASLRSLFSANGLLALCDAPWLAVYVALIWLAHPFLGMTAAAAATLMVALALLNDAMTRRGIETLQSAAAGTTRYLESSMAQAEVVQALGMRDAILARWQAKTDEVAALHGPVACRTVGMAALARTLRQAVQVGMLAVGAWLVLTEQGSPGIIVACTVLLGRALYPVEQLVGSWKLIAQARSAFRNLAQLLDTAAAQPRPMELPAPSGQLTAHAIAFCPAGTDRLLLSGVSLQLQAGESLAVIGPSGAGKSTLLRLLAGVWRPSAGIVRLDGSDIAQWPREQLGPWLGYVPQDVQLFPGTVAENIARLGAVDPALVVHAARRARVHEMIQSLPDGYDTHIDPSSALLSPGQRQRIALARALYGQPRLLLLDEPNSNLDGAGELALAEAIKALRGEVTVVVVTHRTALVQHMQKMLVLEGGKAVHCAPLAEVMKALQARAHQASRSNVVSMPMAAATTMEKAS
jgi:PrtD family type I secretion system ABC transporter